MKITSANKVTRNNGRETAILISYGYGAGWSTWSQHYETEKLFCPVLVIAVLDGHSEDDLETIADSLFDEFNSGARDLGVEWIPTGTRFKVREYDGAESLEILDPSTGHVA